MLKTRCFPSSSNIKVGELFGYQFLAWSFVGSLKLVCKFQRVMFTAIKRLTRFLLSFLDCQGAGGQRNNERLSNQLLFSARISEEFVNGSHRNVYVHCLLPFSGSWLLRKSSPERC